MRWEWEGGTPDPTESTPNSARSADGKKDGRASGESCAVDATAAGRLRSFTGGATDDEALARLGEILRRAAHFETTRRRSTVPHLSRQELEEIAEAAVHTARRTVLVSLGDFRGQSRFTTWASKFALLETAVRLRNIAWQEREVPAVPIAAGELAEDLEPFATGMTARQWHVFQELTIGGVPIDVLADRLGSTRAKVYDTLREARCALRRCVSDAL